MPSLSARSAATLLGDWRPAGRGAIAALADRLQLLVSDGRIPAGTRLPAERELAASLALSRTTVTAVYARLREAGALETVRGSGSVVRIPAAPDAALETEAGLLDLARATLPPVVQLQPALERAVAQLPAWTHAHYDVVGIPPLREAIAERYTARGLATTPDQIMVTMGAQHAISLLARTLVSRGDRVLVETPSYPHALEAFRGVGARLLPVGVTADDGWDDEALEQALAARPRLAYLMPDFHNPTGASMPREQRRRVTALARRAGTLLVVDETISELAIDSPGPLRPFGAAVTLGSLGKSVWGGLRIGWIRADRALVAQLVRARPPHDLGTPVLEQLAAVTLVRQLDEILAERAGFLRAGRDALLDGLGERMPGWRLPRPAGGLTLWAGLGAPISTALTLAARREGVLLTAGPRFGLGGSFERFLRLPFGLAPAQAEQTVDALVRASAALGLGGGGDTEELLDVV